MTKPLPLTICYSLQVLENDGTNCDTALTNGMCCEPAWLEPYPSTFMKTGCRWHPFYPGRSFLFGLRDTAKYNAYLWDQLLPLCWARAGSTFQTKWQKKQMKSAILTRWQVLCKIQIPQAFINVGRKAQYGNMCLM